MPVGQSQQNENADAGIPAELDQKHVEMVNVLIDEDSVMPSSLHRSYSDGKLVSVRSGWHHADEEVDLEEIVDEMFDALEEEVARLSQKGAHAAEPLAPSPDEEKSTGSH
ncbi:MAG: hypothetical protein ACOYM3_23370 [Terrimicrobiaceae bacterium]